MATSHATRLLSMFERDVFPEVGALPIAVVSTHDVLAGRGKWKCVAPTRPRDCSVAEVWYSATQSAQVDARAPELTSMWPQAKSVIRAPERGHFAAQVMIVSVSATYGEGWIATLAASLFEQHCGSRQCSPCGLASYAAQSGHRWI